LKNVVVVGQLSIVLIIILNLRSSIACLALMTPRSHETLKLAKQRLIAGNTTILIFETP